MLGRKRKREQEETSMNNNCEEKVLTDQEEQYIIEQIKYLHEEFVSIQQAFLGIISASLAAYAVAIYYALIAEKDEIFLILPFLFSLSIYNILKYTTRMLGIDAYVCHLEKLLNNSHTKPLFLWQSYMAGANRYLVIGAVPQLPCCAVLSIFLIYRFCLAICGNEYPILMKIAIIILLGLQIVFIVITIMHCATQFFAVSDLCEKMSSDIGFLTDIEQIGFDPRCSYVRRKAKATLLSIRERKNSKKNTGNK